MATIAVAEMRQARSEIMPLALSSTATAVDFPGGVFLFRDFVEVVVTNVCDFRIRREKRDVRIFSRELVWTDHNIIDSVFREEGGSVACPSVDLLYLLLAGSILKPVRPDVTGITHDRLATRQKHRRVVNRCMEDRRGRRSVF